LKSTLQTGERGNLGVTADLEGMIDAAYAAGDKHGLYKWVLQLARKMNAGTDPEEDLREPEPSEWSQVMALHVIACLSKYKPTEDAEFHDWAATVMRNKQTDLLRQRLSWQERLEVAKPFSDEDSYTGKEKKEDYEEAWDRMVNDGDLVSQQLEAEWDSRRYLFMDAKLGNEYAMDLGRGKLPPGPEEARKLRAIEMEQLGYPEAEIAEHLGVGASSVRPLLAKFKEQYPDADRDDPNWMWTRNGKKVERVLQNGELRFCNTPVR
jgi:hypothetical protein